MDSRIPFIDLFCGAGGLSVGFEQAGFNAVYAIDHDPFACQTYAFNHPKAYVYEGDIESVGAKSIRACTQLSKIPLVIGGPNCQGVSLRGKRNPKDPKNKMFFHFKRIVGELKPDWFLMENVPGLLHRHNLDLAAKIFGAFEDIGYKCGGEVLAAADYGVPQLRYRFVLIGNRVGAEVVFPNATHTCQVLDNTGDSRVLDKRPYWRTCLDAIKDLPAIDNGGGEDAVPYPPNRKKLLEYQLMSRKGSGLLYNHVSHNTNEPNIELIKHIPSGKNWKSIPERLRPERFKHVALKDHTTTYGRLRWDMPARTITTYFNNITAGAFTHPEQHRGISVREGARFQSFPDSYRFIGPLSRQYRLVGNAVPCLLSYNLAVMLRSIIRNNSVDRSKTHYPAVTYSKKDKTLIFHRPVKGMRFNLDKHLVRD